MSPLPPLPPLLTASRTAFAPSRRGVLAAGLLPGRRTPHRASCPGVLAAGLLPALLLFAFSLADENENLARGAAVTVSSVHPTFVASNLVDGGKGDGQKSRWVSAEEDMAPWCELTFPAERSLNRVVLYSYSKEYASRDMELFARRGNAWVSLKKMEGNREQNIEITFPVTTTSALRLTFGKGARDHRVRLYEVEAYRTDFSLGNDGLGRGIVDPQGGAALSVQSLLPGGGTLKGRVGYQTLGEGDAVNWSPWQSLVANPTAKISWPKVPAYGRYRFHAELQSLTGSFHTVLTKGVLVVARAPEDSRFTTPYGLHWKGVSAAEWRHLGFFYLRSHDAPEYYWNRMEDSEGRADWRATKEVLAATKAQGLNPVLVVEGVPPQYSTALKTEKNSYDALEYYPPADYGAWFKNYVTPFVGEANLIPGRTWELWNETWSYYRWRGLRGTPAELFYFFRTNYQHLKALDPDAPVMATDTRLVKEGEDNITYKGLTDDLLQLGYLRFTDIANYHAYGRIAPQHPLVIKNRLWAFGRDIPIWNTETGRMLDAQSLILQAVSHRAFGIDRMFLYNDEPVYSHFFGLDGTPTDDLAAFSTLVKILGDGRYLGQMERDGVAIYFFMAKKQAVAVVLANGEKALPLPVEGNGKSRVMDLYGNHLEGKNGVSVATNRPVFVVGPALSWVAEGVSGELKKRVTPDTAEWAPPLWKGDGAQNYFESVVAYGKRLGDRRLSAKGNGDELRWQGEVLEVVDHVAMMLARMGSRATPAPNWAKLESISRATEKQIVAKTLENGALLNSERLLSRGRKMLAEGKLLGLEGDLPGAAVMAARAESDFAASAAFAAGEKVAPIYQPKMYFRSLKRLLRSDVYNFIPGQTQEATATAANPFSTPMAVEIVLEVPAGWKAEPPVFRATVAPFSRENFSCQITPSASCKKGDVVEFFLREKKDLLKAVRSQAVVVDRLPPVPVLSDKKEDDLLPGN